MLARNLAFQKDLKYALATLDRNPDLKNRAWKSIVQLHAETQHEEGRKGLIAGLNARQRLLQKERRKEQEHERQLDTMINETAQTSALHATKLSQLLKKKWTEEKNAYKLMSNIRTDKQ